MTILKLRLGSFANIILVMIITTLFSFMLFVNDDQNNCSMFCFKMIIKTFVFSCAYDNDSPNTVAEGVPHLFVVSESDLLGQPRPVDSTASRGARSIKYIWERAPEASWR